MGDGVFESIYMAIFTVRIKLGTKGCYARDDCGLCVCVCF